MISSNELNFNQSILTEIKSEYQSIYVDYITNISLEKVASSLEQCVLLSYILRNINVSNVLDTGSGISTYIIRNEQKNKPFRSITFESNPYWLEKTKSFLESQNLDSSNIYHWDTIKSDTSYKQFDFIYHDLDNIETRIDTLRSMMDRLSVGGYILCWMMPTLTYHQRRCIQI